MFSKETSSFGLSFLLNSAAIIMVFCGLLAAGVSSVNAQAFTEGFAVVPVPGWTVQNNSIPIGSTGWFQGNSTVFPAQAGPATSYIGANFNNTTGTNTISNWLITPQRTLLSAGDVITFYTRTTTANPFPDRLQVRLSLAGASTNVGSGPAGLGDFTTLLLDINPTYMTGGAYPEVWTQFTITLTAAHVPVPASGRIAFRYFVEMGGPTGDNSNYIGIDTFSYTPGMVVAPGDAPVDFNGDGKTDYVVLRNVGGGINGQVRWFWNLNGLANPTAASDWGLASDEFFSEDFDGDDKDDIACWRQGAPTIAAFYILQSMTNTVRVEAFGQTGDDPSIVDDYNGDNKADLAVYRPGANATTTSTWFYRTAVNGPITFIPWGVGGINDFAVPGDYDGNGSADFVIQRISGGVGQFWIRLSTGVVQPVVFFGGVDLVVPGDYDGDGKTDIAVVRGISGSLVWFWRPSGGGANQQVTFGSSATDFPTQGDYDGDGRTDVAIWRPSATPNVTAFWSRSTVSGAVSVFVLGANLDIPVANYNTH